MYIRKASRTYKGKTYSNYLLVESIVTPKGPRQKVICSLGDLSPRPKQDWLALAHKLESALCGQSDLVSSSDSAELERLVAKVKSSAVAPIPAPARRRRRPRGPCRGSSRWRALRRIARGRTGPCGLPVLAPPGTGFDSGQGGLE